MSIWSLTYQRSAYLSFITQWQIFLGVFTYKMAAKINRHRYGTKLRHCVTLCIVDDAGMHAARMRSRVYITVRRPSFSPIDSSDSGRRVCCRHRSIAAGAGAQQQMRVALCWEPTEDMLNTDLFKEVCTALSAGTSVMWSEVGVVVRWAWSALRRVYDWLSRRSLLSCWRRLRGTVLDVNTGRVVYTPSFTSRLSQLITSSLSCSDHL